MNINELKTNYQRAASAANYSILRHPARSVVETLHPTSPLVLHEQDGYQQLWGLQGHQLGQPEKILTLEDFKACESPTFPR